MIDNKVITLTPKMIEAIKAYDSPENQKDISEIIDLLEESFSVEIRLLPTVLPKKDIK